MYSHQSNPTSLMVRAPPLCPDHKTNSKKTQCRLLFFCLLIFFFCCDTFIQDNISPAILKKIKPYVENPNMQIDVVTKVSKAASGLCMFVHAMDVRSFVCLFYRTVPRLFALPCCCSSGPCANGRHRG